LFSPVGVMLDTVKCDESTESIVIGSHD